MNREQLSRSGFPAAGAGYDRDSVDAHLAAVAAWVSALEAQISALEVERDALRRHLAEGVESAPVASAPSVGVGAGPGPAAAAAESAQAAISEGTVAEPVGATSDEAEQVQNETDGATASREHQVSARLVATRLALEGSKRDEIVSRLADDYELDDPAGLVDDVLTRLS